MKNWIMKMLFPIALFLIASNAFSADVKNERVRQEGNRVVFEYDLESDKETDIGITLTIEGKKYAAKDLHLEGDYGKIRPGKNKRVYWNVLQDFPRGLQGNFKISINTGGGAGMVFVKGGCYEMGDAFGNGKGHERPVHKVCVDDFYISQYEVIVGEFREFAEKTGYKTDAEKGNGCDYWTGSKLEKDRSKYWGNPGFFQSENDPVVCVSWNDANEYLKWKSNVTGNRYRLLTESEWEYAARSSGEKQMWAGSNDESKLSDYSWYIKNSGSRTHPVGQKRPNQLELYDMSGNVWEWTSDAYDEQYYNVSPIKNPKGPGNGLYRVLRGGSWLHDSNSARVSNRGRVAPDYSGPGLGFRIASDK